MWTPSKEFLGVFIPLSANDLARLCADPTLKAAYLDGISYMHDLVSSYTDNPTHNYFEVEEAIIDCGVIKQRHFNGKDSLSKHFKYNFETAQYFGTQGQSIIGVDSAENIILLKRDSTAYIKALLQTYNLVRTAE